MKRLLFFVVTATAVIVVAFVYQSGHTTIHCEGATFDVRKGQSCPIYVYQHDPTPSPS